VRADRNEMRSPPNDAVTESDGRTDFQMSVRNFALVVTLRYSEGSRPCRGYRSFGVPQDDRVLPAGARSRTAI
jgi:hypothetical protein